MSFASYTLGIDLGVASIGWACVSEKDRQLAAGVRIFPAGIDKMGSSKEGHKNEKRRSARGARRRFARKAKRKRLVRDILTGLGWIPSDPEALQEWESLPVYELRHRALSEKISLAELARIILHLNQRRGFLSLRKSEMEGAEGEEKKELEGILGSMDALQKEIDEGGFQTLGNYLHHLYHDNGMLVRLRGRYIRRQMLYHEFDLIWNEQQKHHPVLTDELRYGSHGKQADPIAVTKPVPRDRSKSLLEQFGLENLTFFQRKVYWKTSSIGRCELLPEELRAPVADRRFQEFRMLGEVNNLRLIDHSAPGSPVARRLNDAERAAAIHYLSTTAKAKLSSLKGILAKLPGSPAKEQIAFNLENNERDTISTLETDIKLAKALGYDVKKKEEYQKWQAFDGAIKDRIVEILTLPDESRNRVIQRTDDETSELLAQVDGLTKEQIEALVRLPLPAGYGALSVKALDRLLEHMRDGLVYQAKDESDSARHRAGFPRRDEVAHRIHEELPHLAQLTDPRNELHDPQFPHISNPVVLRTLHELRKVVNAIVRKHGRPEAIHLEMARDLKMNSQQRKEHRAKALKHEKERENAKKFLESLGVVATRDAILVHRLWEEQGKTCIYSGKTIPPYVLFSGRGELDVDHILPRRAQDDSYMNKVLCYAKSNRDKKDRLPIEWLGSDSDEFEALTQRAKKLPYPKYQRIIRQDIPQEWANRDFTDTAYMTRAARYYLSYLVDEPHKVFCSKGSHTALLRKQWELNSLLREDGEDIKNRDDHRHHALDAVTIALIDRSTLQKLNDDLKYEARIRESTDPEDGGKRIYRLKPVFEKPDLPWKTFRLDLKETLGHMLVSHRPNRKVSGPLHQETNYGPTGEEGLLVRRKSVSALSEGEITRIRDGKIRRLIEEYLQREPFLYREDLGNKVPDELSPILERKGFLNADDIRAAMDERDAGFYLKKLEKKNQLIDAERGRIKHPVSGIPIKKVRITVPNKVAVPLRPSRPGEYVIPGNTHHLAIFSLGEDKHLFIPVTMLEAARRLKRKIPVVQTLPPPGYPEAEFLFHLCPGDSMMATIDGKDELFIFNTMATSSLQTWFAHHYDATDGHKHPLTGVSLLRSCMPGSFPTKFPFARKVELGLLGG